MCDLCDEGIACPNCGILICWDAKARDDVVAPAGMTDAGDVFCIDCAREMDEAERDYDDEMGYAPEPYEEVP